MGAGSDGSTSAIPGIHLIIEYDGRQHAFDVEQWRSDITRREELDELGLRIIVVESTGIYLEPLRTLERIRAALRERGVKVPRTFRTEWTRHFPAAA